MNYQGNVPVILHYMLFMNSDDVEASNLSISTSALPTE
jgi:hypothetical protein